MNKEHLKARIKELEKGIRAYERAQSIGDAAEKVNELLAHYAQGWGSFGKALIALSSRLNVGRTTLMSWACEEASPRTKQRESLDRLYSEVFPQ